MAKAPSDMAKAAALRAQSGSAIAFAQEKAAVLQEKAAFLQKKGGETCTAFQDRALNFARATKVKMETMARDRRVQVTAASTAAGGAAVGAGGAAVGLLTGGTIGAACGIPFALFTFGLSIPVTAMIGGGFGLVTGGAVGTTVGATTGGAVGFGAYTKRAEIKAGIKKAKEVAVYLAARAYARARTLKSQVLVRIGSIRNMVEKKVGGS